MICREHDFDKYAVTNGTFEFNDIQVAITQDPYYTGNNGGDWYEAHAIDRDENWYLVKWDILDSYRRMTDDEQADEQNACDWENPSSISNA